MTTKDLSDIELSIYRQVLSLQGTMADKEKQLKDSNRTVNKFHYNIKDFLTNNSITADDFRDPILVTTTIKFNEKTSR